jgi:polyisoprenoid-binding protein YceI
MVAPKIGFMPAAGLVLVLAGCTAVQERYPPTAEPVRPAVTGVPWGPVPGARRYALNAQASQLLVFVYRTGRMARLGHNHLISVGELEGDLWLAEPLSDSRVEIRLPVHTLVVDDPQLRAAAGPDFDSEPSPQDIANTRRNMLGAQVLNAAAHPWITLRGTPDGGRLPDLELDAELEIHGRTGRMRLPVHVESAPGRVLVSGEFRLRQSDFGITPYSVMMGALAVQDELTVRYRLVAEPAD